MAKRLQNPRLAKIHRSYTVDEAADLYGVHKNTVRHWIEQGLVICGINRPTLIRGHDLNDFHAKRRVKNKSPCKMDEIYCLKCRQPQKPINGMVEYKQVNDKTGNLRAICPVCAGWIFKRISNAKIKEFMDGMGFTLAEADLHIIDSTQPSLNCDFSKGVNKHVKSPSR